MPNKDQMKVYDQEMLRSAVASLFWGIITERRKDGPLTLRSLADELGIDKSAVSRWFSDGAPNWEMNTVADIASALGVDLVVQAVERSTGRIYSATGIIDPQAQPELQRVRPNERPVTTTDVIQTRSIEASPSGVVVA